MPPTEEQREARARIAELEKNPKHAGRDDIASAQTVVDALDDPKHNAATPLDSRWKKSRPKTGVVGRALAALRIRDIEEVWIDPDEEV
jgi:hypothetical protein